MIATGYGRGRTGRTASVLLCAAGLALVVGGCADRAKPGSQLWPNVSYQTAGPLRPAQTVLSVLDPVTLAVDEAAGSRRFFVINADPGREVETVVEMVDGTFQTLNIPPSTQLQLAREPVRLVDVR
ncbi:MAG: hypothetical protein ACTS3R_17205 [Inquilinaceae bacterium]